MYCSQHLLFAVLFTPLITQPKTQNNKQQYFFRAVLYFPLPISLKNVYVMKYYFRKYYILLEFNTMH